MIWEFIQSVGTVRLILGIYSLHILLSSAEFISTLQRYATGGILSWRVSKLRIERSRITGVLTSLLKPPRFQYLLYGRVLAGAFLLTASVLDSLSLFVTVSLLFVFVSDIAIFVRHQGGLSGDNHISVVLSLGLAVATAVPEGTLLYTASLLFIAVQALLSYFIAGVLKLSSDTWRDGTALLDTFSTRTWGHEWMYRQLTSSRLFCLSGAWLVIVFESLFPLVFIAPEQLTVVFLVSGVLFHLSNALFIHLNGFLIAFPATYPAIVHINNLLPP